MKNKILTIQPNTHSSQSKNCWLFVQIRTTAFYFWRFWRMDNTDGGWHIEIATPKYGKC